MLDLSYFDYSLIFLVTLLTKSIGIITGGMSFVLQPTLLLFGVPPHMAISHDIGATAGASLTGARAFTKQKNINWSLAFQWIPGMVLGVSLGVFVLDQIPPEWVETIILVLCIAGAIGMIFKKNSPSSGRSERHQHLSFNVYTVLLSFVAGTYMGLSGAGLGTALTMLCVWFYGLDLKKSIGTVRALLLPSLIFGTLNFYIYGFLDLKLFLTMFVASMCSGILGAHLVHRLNAQVLKYIFNISAILVCVFVLLK